MPVVPMLSRFRLVLVAPRTPGNVGACARVAANFGCSDWCIVAAQCDWTDWESRKFATGEARGYLDGAKPVATVIEAVRDCQIAIGFSRRQGKLRKPTIQVSEIARLVTAKSRVALVFGNEETGLSNDELESCTKLCILPTGEIAPSMNLSHAVAVVLARIYSDALELARVPRGERVPSPARLAELEGMMSHWEEFLVDIDTTRAQVPAPIDAREHMASTLRRIFARADLSPREIRALRGLLAKAQVKLGVRKRGRRVKS